MLQCIHYLAILAMSTANCTAKGFTGSSKLVIKCCRKNSFSFSVIALK